MDAAVLSVVSIGAALGLGAISPGPSFILVARTAVASSRRAGIGAALGMGAGSLVFATIALLGLHTLLTAVPVLWLVMKTLGGLYLLWMAYKMFRGARDPLALELPGSNGKTMQRAFLTAFTTQISNPKTALVFSGVFAALLPQQVSTGMFIAIPLVAMMIDGLWYLFVAYALSSRGPRNTYLRFKAPLDRLGGTVMAALGIRLIVK
ncbi:LysE family translocator [Erwinia sp. E602]|uniref:LysE family translocator n=1 Tax=Erwinia sp. E602 TaxID=2675378 RepID=UPI001BA964C1|nr:LysE family transporter [Erwinia sp. E602]QUG74220.1 LysE family translocator [Erwinia sp. E602]